MFIVAQRNVFLPEDVDSRKVLRRRKSFYKRSTMDNNFHVAVTFILWFCSNVAWAQPALETSELHLSTIQGKDAILPCMTFITDTSELNGYKVTWTNPMKAIITYNQEVITYDKRFSVLKPYATDWNLRISRVQKSDSGKYTCSINTTPVEMKAVFLHVQVSPRISSEAQVEVKEGDTLKVYCNVTGDPFPTVSWYKNNEVLPKFTGDVLQINVTARTDDGIYKCVAINGVEPNAYVDIDVDVLYPPMVKLFHESISQYRFKDVVLICNIYGNPKGHEKWFRNGEEIHTNWKYKVENYTDEEGRWTTSLLIRYLDKNDFGEYICHVASRLGSDSASVQLYEITSSTSTKSTVATVKSVLDITTKKILPSENNPLSAGHFTSVDINGDAEKTSLDSNRQTGTKHKESYDLVDVNGINSSKFLLAHSLTTYLIYTNIVTCWIFSLFKDYHNLIHP